MAAEEQQAAVEQPKKITGGAFGRFLNEKRGELMKECAGKPASAVVKLASERFKAFSEAERAAYEEKYKQAKEQYEKDMEAFLAAGGEKKAVKRKGNNVEEESAKRRKKDPDAPKKPAGGAYGCFLAKHRPEFMEQTKGKPITEVSKLASEKWKALSEEDKKPFQEEYAQKLEAYKAAMKDYVPPEPKVDEKAAAKQAKEEAKAAKAAEKEAAKEAKEAEKEAKAAEKEKEKEKKTKAKEKEAAAKEKAKEKEAAAKAKAKEKEAAAKAKAKAKLLKAKTFHRGRGKAKAKAKAAAPAVELQATVAAKAEKEGLTAKLIQLASRQDVIDSKKSQTAILKALQDSGGLIHPARRALLGA